MADANALPLGEILDAVIGNRFPSARRNTDGKRWVSAAYQDVWDAGRWTFKTVTRADFAVTVSPTPAMPADFADAKRLFDDQGSPIARMSEQDFENVFGAQLAQSSSGGVDGYMVANRQIWLGPLPAAAATYKLTYRRRVSCRDQTGTVKAGVMSAETDYPLWDDHHDAIVARAQARGLLEINDPLWRDSQDEYERQLDRMRDDYTVRLVGQLGDAWDA